MYWFPKTRMARVSIWLGISGLLVIILLNVITQIAFCGICPDGYRKEGDVCNPNCYYTTPKCLAPSVAPGCNNNVLDNNSPWRTIDMILGLLAMASILGSGVMAFISIIKYRERAILIFIPALLGLLGLMFVIGEFLFPH